MKGFVRHALDPLSTDEAIARGRAFFETMNARRSVRCFSDEPVDRELIALAIRTASTAPSGAHRQPWRFVAVSDPALKRRIREAAEAEEKRTYDRRMPEEWRSALAPLGTTWRKPFLESVPWLVIVFVERYGHDAEGRRRRNYYVQESTGLACGLFITALHRMGLATVPYTPSPMRFLSELLGRPENERPFLVFPVGKAAEDCEVPALERKSLDQVSAWYT